MSTESDHEIVRRLFEEVWNAGDPDAAKEIVGESYTSIENQTFPTLPGPEIVAAELALYQTLYTGLNFKVERMFSEGRTIVTVWQATGESTTETFETRGGETVPKSLEAEGVSLTEVTDGKVTAHRFLWPRYPLFP
jgi:hypothetical protein